MRQHRVAIDVVVFGLAVGSIVPAMAQRSPHLPRIGLLAWDVCEWPNVMAGLADRGYVPGKNVTTECRSAGGRDEGLARAAVELVNLPVDIIVTDSQPAGRAARAATKSIPIVTIISGDPVADGLAQSLAHPGGNLTGISYYATELTAKRLELLREAVPAASIVGVLANPKVSYLPFEADTRRAAQSLGVSLIVAYVREPSDLDSAFSQLKAQGAQAAFVLPDLMLANQAKRIAELALTEQLPMMAWGGWYTEAGGLMAYAADYAALNRRLAIYVDKILKGATPADLPIEQPARFDLSINLHTARMLGLSLPPALISRADRVIE